MKITRSQLRNLISEAILSEIGGPTDKELLDLSNVVKTDILRYIDSPDLGTKTWKSRIEKKINSIDSNNPSADDRKIKFLKSFEPASDDIIRKIKKDIWSIKPRMSNASETLWLLKKSADGAYRSKTNEIIINTATYTTLINTLSLEDILYHEFFHALDFVLGRVTGNTGKRSVSFFSEEISLIINGEIKNNPDIWRQKMIQMGATKFFLIGKTDKFIKREFEKAAEQGHVNVYLRQLRRIFGTENPIKKACNLTFEEWDSLSDDIKMFVTMLSCTKEAQDAEDRIASTSSTKDSYA